MPCPEPRPRAARADAAPRPSETNTRVPPLLALADGGADGVKAVIKKKLGENEVSARDECAACPVKRLPRAPCRRRDPPDRPPASRPARACADADAPRLPQKWAAADDAFKKEVRDILQKTDLKAKMEAVIQGK